MHLRTIDRIFLLLQLGFVQIHRVHPAHDGLDVAKVLKQHKLQEDQVEHTQAKNHAPNGRMGPDKGAVGEGQDTDHQKDERDGFDARPDIFVCVGISSEKSAELVHM